MSIPLRLSPLSALGAAAAMVALAPGASAADSPRVAQFTAPTAVLAGQRVALSGRVVPARAGHASVQRLQRNGSWKPIATVRVDRRGRFAAKLPFSRSSSLRVVARGPQGPGAPSRRRSVALKRTAKVSIVTDASERILSRGLSVRGKVAPARPGETVRILGRRKGKTVTLATTRAGVGGHVAATVQMPSGGGWRILLEARGRKGFDTTGIGVSVPVWMYGKNPHNVPSSSSRYIVQVLSERQMYYYEEGSLRRVFPVVFGKPSTPTPLGTYRVYSKTAGPGPAFGPLAMWYHRGYGIHGTNQEHLLTHRQRYYSLGCTRNYNDNIRWLFPRVPVGTPVRNIA